MSKVRTDVWRLRVSVLDPETDTRRQVSRTVHFDRGEGTKTAAKEALEAFRAEVKAGDVVGTTATVGALLDRWMEKVKSLGRSQGTIDSYSTQVTHLRAALGSVRLDKLTRHQLEDYFADLTENYAPASVQLNWRVLRAALNYAVDLDWLKTNPAARIKLRPVRQAEYHLDADGLRALYFGVEKKGRHLKGALEEDPDLAVVIVLAAITGCRRGELLGLKWDDVDWDRQCLKIQRQRTTGSTGVRVIEHTKTRQNRTVFIGEAGAAILDQYRADKAEMMGREPKGWLLSYDGGTTPLRPKSVSEYVSRLGRRVGVPVHFHQLRHFAATELNAAGVDLPTAAAQLGHSPAVMAGTYLHSSDERGAKAGELIGSLVAGALTQ